MIEFFFATVFVQNYQTDYTTFSSEYKGIYRKRACFYRRCIIEQRLTLKKKSYRLFYGQSVNH